ncbi:hypothetical protein V5N11_031631 [Cardamine amara subsp. amara]|uniref:Retrotransposon gag domain-containing protein n=1 Tax=Cardamine amara subsp. amara TaxID=228776 RepID=A0ABD0ZGA4_CARAN
MIHELLTHMLQQQQQPQPNAQRTYMEESARESVPSKFLKLVTMMRDLGIHKFKGEQNTIAAEKWLQNLETNFDISRCPQEFKVQLAEYFLDEDAYTWWEIVMPRYILKYFPPEARDRWERQFNSLEQGKQSV